VAEHVEKKNGFSYVSWPFAVAELRKRHPEATWEVVRFEGLPYQQTPAGVFVEVAVTVNGIRLSQIHPVLDHANKPIKEPTAFQINTSIQRCLVKAIALHGLGLFVYAGEDLPEGSDARGDVQRVDRQLVDATVLEFRTALAFDAPEEELAEAVFAVHSRMAGDEDLYVAVGDALTPAERAAIKRCVALHKQIVAQRPVNARGR
jgi:hypothetical protein